jgi:hypothetical protein
MKERRCEAAVIAALSLYPMTVAELVHETGFARRSVQTVLQRLHDDDPKQVFIKKFDDTIDKLIAYPKPVYALGNERDAKRRQVSNSVRCARSKAKLARYAQERDARGEFPLGSVWHQVAST